MSYKYIALANFTANIDGKHTEIREGDELVLSARHPELDMYINPKDEDQHNYKKPGHRAYGMVVCEEIEDSKKESKKDSKKESKK